MNDMENSEKQFSALQAYNAMCEYIKEYALRVSAEDLLVFCKNLELSGNGVTADPTYSYKWAWAVDKVSGDYRAFYISCISEKIYQNTKHFPEVVQDPNQRLTYLQGLNATCIYLSIHYFETGSDSAAALASDMNIFIFADEGTADPAAWEDWLDAIEVVLKKDNSVEIPLE